MITIIARKNTHIEAQTEVTACNYSLFCRVKIREITFDSVLFDFRSPRNPEFGIQNDKG